MAMANPEAEPPPFGALVLAAGKGVRFGCDKRLARMADERTLLQTTLSLYLEVFTDVLVVLGENDGDLARQIQAYFDALNKLEILLAPEASEGMGGSLRAGGRSILARPMPWLMTFIALGDMPYIRTQTLKTLLADAASTTQATTANSILVPSKTHQHGHPIGIGKNFLGELAQCNGEQGARHLLRTEAAHVRQIRLSDPGILVDIDRPEDLV